MPDIFEVDAYTVTNLLGHITGIVIFGMFITFVLNNRYANGMRARRLAISAAALALLWNLSSLTVLFINNNYPLDRIIAAFGFCLLSLLPAVMLDIYLANRSHELIRCGYGISTLAIIAHIIERLQESPLYDQVDLAIVLAGFSTLTIVSALKVWRSESGHIRLPSLLILASMPLFLFSASFGPSCEGQSHHAWSVELAFHHVGIPVALFILLTDQRFVLLDILIRLFSDGLLAGLFALGIAASSSSLEFTSQVLFTGLMLIAFVSIRDRVRRFLTRIIWRQPDIQNVTGELRELRAQAADEDAYLQNASEKLALCMKADLIEMPAVSDLLPAGLMLPALSMHLPQARELQRNGIEAVVPIRLGQGDFKYILLGERRGGRSYLNKDIETLTRLAAYIAEEVDKIREIEMRRLMSQAELRALQSQIHPHFLFNAFNTLYGIIPRAAADARQMVLNLSDIFRYFLQSGKTYISLEEEMRIIRAYLSIEELRLGEKLRIIMEVEENAKNELIPILSIQPLVENAVKHGIAARPEGGTIRIEVKRTAGGLQVQVHDTGLGFSTRQSSKPKEHAGIGIENVSRRLHLCYGPAAKLDLESSDDGTTVSFFVPDTHSFDTAYAQFSPTASLRVAHALTVI